MPKRTDISKIAVLSILLTGLSTYARACSYYTLGPRVGSNVTLQLDLAGKPWSGELVKLSILFSKDKEKGWVFKEVASAKTNAAGEVTFKELPIGDYQAEAHKESFGSVTFTVSSELGAEDSKVQLHWPRVLLLKTNKLRGSLTQSEVNFSSFSDTSNFEVPSARAKLTVTEALSGNQVYTGESDGTGRFEFVEARAGVYYLHYEGSVEVVRYGQTAQAYEAGDIAIKVDPSATESNLQILLQDSCPGPNYKLLTETKG